MSNGRGRRAKRRGAPASVPAIDRTPPSSVIYYRSSDDTVPALEFLDACPGKLEGEFTAVLDGRRKPWRTVLSAADYRAVKKLGEDHKRQHPRRIAS
jgi:hypothetical protein